MDTAIRREVRGLLIKGEDALGRHDYERASGYFRKAYSLDPDNIKAVVNLGFSYVKMGRLSHAQKCFSSALEIDPENPVARKNLNLLTRPQTRAGYQPRYKPRPEEELYIRYMQWGNLQFEAGNYYAAVQYYQSAAAIHPDFIEPYMKTGLCYEELREFSRAVSAFEDALSIYPNDPVAKEHLATCMGLIEEEESRPRPKAPEKRVIPKPPEPTPLEPARPSAPPAPARSAARSDDDMIDAILNQYSNLLSDAAEKKKVPETQVRIEEEIIPPADSEKVAESEPAPEVVPSPSPAKPSGSPGGMDDAVSNILSQFADEIPAGDGGTGGGKGTESEPAPEVVPSPSPAKPSGSPGGMDDAVSNILSQFADEIPAGEGGTGGEKAAESEPAPEVVPSPPPVKPAASPGGMDDAVSSILSQYADEIPPDDGEKKEEGTSPTEPEFQTGAAPLSSGDKLPKKNGIRVELTDNQKDALRELGNIGASHAATTLSTMLNTPIMLNVPEIAIVDFHEINRQIVQENSAMVIFTMEGQMKQAGYVILHVPQESVVQMTSIMLGMPVEPSRALNEMDESAINEIGNIMVSAFLDGTAELLGIIMLPSPPRTIFDLPKNVFDLVINESNILYDNVVFFKTELICDEHELNLNIFMIPNPPVLTSIVRMLEKIIEDSASTE